MMKHKWHILQDDDRNTSGKGGMKKVIDLLRTAHRHLTIEGLSQSTQMDMIADARGYIASAIAALWPRWETPEQYKKRTGKKWPNNAAVWFRHTHKNPNGKISWFNWEPRRYCTLDYDFRPPHHQQIVCVTGPDAPQKNWKPKEDE